MSRPQYNCRMSVPRGLTSAVLLLVIVGALWAAMHRDPWDPDETRYLQVTRELIQSGNPFFLRYNTDAYTEKPPIFFWTLVPFVAVFGADSAVAGMLPSLIAWLLLGLATRRLGRAADLSPEVCRWGSLLFVSALLPVVLAGGCRMDMLFALWCTLALERLVRLADRREQKNPHQLYFWLWIGLGVLTKGPLAILLPLLPAMILGRAGWRAARRAFSGWGPLLAIALVLAWLVPAALTGGREWLETIVIHQSAGRAVSSFAHRSPWWYHMATVPLTLMPWSLLALLGTVAAFSQAHALRDGGRIMAAYPVAGLAFLSLLSGKTFLYPLPLFPAACLVAAWWLTRSPDHLAQRLALGVSALTPLALGLGLVLFVAPRPDMNLSTLSTALVAAGLILPAGISLVTNVGRDVKLALASLLLTIPLFSVLGLSQLVPPFNRLLSLRPFAAAYAAADSSAEGPGIAYAKIQPGFVLFSNRPFHALKTPAELARALAAGRAVAIDAKTARRVSRESQLSWTVSARVPYRHSEVLVIAPSPR